MKIFQFIRRLFRRKAGISPHDFWLRAIVCRAKRLERLAANLNEEDSPAFHYTKGLVHQGCVEALCSVRAADMKSIAATLQEHIIEYENLINEAT